MSGEHLVMANLFVECMDDNDVTVLGVVVEIWDEYGVVTDIDYQVAGGRLPQEAISDACFLEVNETLAERRSG